MLGQVKKNTIWQYVLINSFKNMVVRVEGQIIIYIHEKKDKSVKNYENLTLQKI